jgi:4'-phosphopantetheinyl transferase
MGTSLPATTIYPVILAVPQMDQSLTGRQKVEALSRHARVALRQSCRKSGLQLNDLPKDDRGVPLPVDGIYWSLSHKSGVVGGVAAPLPVGLDVETIRPVSDALMRKIADEREWALAQDDRQTLFFRFWTAKEAVLKAVGEGIAGLPRCRIAGIDDDTRMLLTYDHTAWPVVHHQFDKHVAALTPHHYRVDWSTGS